MTEKLKIAGLIVLLLFGFNVGWSQKRNIPGEKIFAHLSEQCLFSGENLWLTVFVTNYDDLPGKQISHLAFVELVDSKNTSLIRKKILLEEGVGSCSFEIPDSVTTGIYHVLAYTNWSKNFGDSGNCKTRLLVFNPNSPLNEIGQKTISESIIPDKSDINHFEIRTKKTTYAKREKVDVEFDFGNKDFDWANFSVSVRQKEPGQIRQLTGEVLGITKGEIDEIKYYPDYKGILLSGHVLDKINNNPAVGKEIILSFPGRNVEIKYAKTNQNGGFNFLLEHQKGEVDLVFNLPSDEYIVKLNDPFINGFEQEPEQEKLIFSDSAIKYLKDRFIDIQLRERFRQTNVLDTAKSEEERDADFFGESYQIVKLEDFKRLDSISEYFYELIPTVHFSKKQGEQQLYITNPETNFKLGDNPAVFIDGVFYPGLAELAMLDHNLVKEISVIPKVYYYRDKTYDGIISIKTSGKNFNQVKKLDNMVRIIYPVSDICPSFKILDPYVEYKTKHTPDIRTLLHWQNNLLFTKEKQDVVSFYTSDIEGDFLISVAGMTNSGDFIKMEKTINVLSE